jgi:glycosyltransferase involved in cell wall biosynthesis
MIRKPLRIVYLLESTEISGGVKVALLQAEALARRGHRVAVVSPAPSPHWFPLTHAHFERSSFRESREAASADIRVATFWTTVAPALAGSHGPVFHLCQGIESDFSFYREVKERIEEAYRAPTRKLAVSATLAGRLDERGFGPAENVGQAFDAQPFFPAPSGARRNGHVPTVLLVGPFEADVKGVAVALDGLALWRERGGEFRLRRVSPLPPSEAERRMRLGGEYHTCLPPDRMPFAYRSADLFVGPCRPQEGFGLPVLEALACGVPALLSDTAGHRELAADAAWYFRDGDPDALAGALPLLTSSVARERARAAGPARARRFDTASVAESLEKAFSRSLSGGDRA